MSRTRLIRPEFFTDELMAQASIPTRFVYIGLWTLCDDAGYFECKPRQIAAALFSFDGVRHREKLVDAALAELVQLDRVKRLDCGLHGYVPTLVKNGQRGGNKSFTHRERHLADCRVRTTPAQVPPSTDKSRPVLVSESVLVSVEKGASAGDDGSLSEFRSKVPVAVALGGESA